MPQEDMSLEQEKMPGTKAGQKRRGSTDSPGVGPSQKVARTGEKTTTEVEENSSSPTAAATAAAAAAAAGTAGTTALDQLAKLSTIVADSADFEAIKEYNPVDATTNPTLVLQAVNNPKYKHLLDKAIKEAKEAAKGKSQEIIIEEAIDRVLVLFGIEILQIIPGLVSTEIPADLSFNQQGSVERARRIIKLYEEKGINKERILIKIAATWEGIQAAKELKKENINCNITLLFSLCQAIAASDAGAALVSPFVGRILDWYKEKEPKNNYNGINDPGVQSVTQIYNYFKHFNSKTTVMAASFRNTDEILNLAGCDKLTISPKLLEELKKIKKEEKIIPRVSVQLAKKEKIKKLDINEQLFRWMLNEDPMATEKLAEGIRNFARDMNKLREIIKEQL